MGVFQNHLLAGAAAAASGDAAWAGIEAIARFDSADECEMIRTQVAATLEDKWTLSFWWKRASTGGSQGIITGNKPSSGDNADHIFFHSTNSLRWEAQDYNGNLGNSNASYSVYTDSAYSSTTAWYHGVCTYDSTQSTASDRVKWYVSSASAHGTSSRYSGQPAQNRTPPMNAGVVSGTGYKTHIGYMGPYDSWYNGRLGEVIFIDGSIYAPTQFAHDVSGTWTAKNPDVDSISWGDNGFYLRFLENDNLGKDYSGNENDLSTSNMGTDHQETSNLPPSDSS